MTDYATIYRDTLLNDIMPFWQRHGMDEQHGGIMTCLDRDDSVLDTDKSVWFQGRAGWMFATLYNTLDKRRVAGGGALLRGVFASALPLARGEDVF